MTMSHAGGQSNGRMGWACPHCRIGCLECYIDDQGAAQEKVEPARATGGVNSLLHSSPAAAHPLGTRALEAEILAMRREFWRLFGRGGR